MKVAYDITVLGNAQRHRWQRTGVFRVVDEVARGLVRAIGSELSFSCLADPNVLEDCRTYTEADPVLRQVPLLGNRLASEPGADRGLVSRAARGIARRVAKALPAFGKGELASFDVFHAPAFFLPEVLDRTPKVQAFLTVCDLIPILFPQLCRDGSRQFVERALDSLHGSRWAICISESTKADLCNHLPSFDPKQALVVPLAASDRFYPCTDAVTQANVRSRYGIPNGPYFLSLSTLEPRKNIDHLIRCFGRLLAEAKIKDVNLVLVGEKGWDYQSIFTTLDACEVARDKVILPGFVADEDLAPLYSGALAFVYPSLYEGFGLPPLEAMQAGTPVITSNSSSLPEVVGDAGIMVGPSEGDALCQAMFSIYHDPSLALDLSQRGIKRARLFSWEKCVDQTLAAYQTALDTD